MYVTSAIWRSRHIPSGEEGAFAYHGFITKDEYSMHLRTHRIHHFLWQEYGCVKRDQLQGVKASENGRECHHKCANRAKQKTHDIQTVIARNRFGKYCQPVSLFHRWSTDSVWYGMVWYGMVWYGGSHLYFVFKSFQVRFPAKRPTSNRWKTKHCCVGGR
jgi:DUF1365 family protein